jgi:hypothetical protein
VASSGLALGKIYRCGRSAQCEFAGQLRSLRDARVCRSHSDTGIATLTRAGHLFARRGCEIEFKSDYPEQGGLHEYEDLESGRAASEQCNIA